jgi:hypothetical protein
VLELLRPADWNGHIEMRVATPIIGLLLAANFVRAGAGIAVAVIAAPS